MMNPTTVADFAAACKDLDQEEIYELFEIDISQELRDLIYDYSTTDDAPEPVREALNKIGNIYGIKSLQDY